MTYIKPPASHECTWRSGPPPEVGWWPASVDRRSNSLRWWNGEFWSVHGWSVESKEVAGQYAKIRSFHPGIQWTDRWWLKSRKETK